MSQRWAPFAALAIVAAGCHLALGLETAEEIDSTTSAAPECTQNAQCNDNNPCTDDLCDSSVCLHVPQDGAAPAALQTASDCKMAACNMGVLEPTNDDTDVLVDGNPCTADLCNNGVPSNPPMDGGTPCPTGVCNGGISCTECFDNSQCAAPNSCGGGGTPFECGCTPLTCDDVNLTCGNAPTGCVGALNCDTGAIDGDETDIDCGGLTTTCSRRCSDGQMCNVPGDCNSNVCTSGSCVGN